MSYKTKMCHIWEVKGVCDRPQCSFAHGQAELRSSHQPHQPHQPHRPHQPRQPRQPHQHPPQALQQQLAVIATPREDSRAGGVIEQRPSCKMAHPDAPRSGGETKTQPPAKTPRPQPKVAASAECPICCTLKGSAATTSCCGQRICYACVKGILVCKESLAKELTRDFLGRAHQCPKCSFGPVEHYACSNLGESGRNSCPKCRFFSPNLRDWAMWNGTLPPSLRSMEGHFPCPFCREDSALSAAFGADTQFCTRCKKMGHVAPDCTFIECGQCGRPGHHARACTDVVCHVCKKRGHRASQCIFSVPRPRATSALA